MTSSDARTHQTVVEPLEVIRWTSAALPKCPAVARAADAPLGVVVQPLGHSHCARIAVKSPEHIARCHACFAYVSHACAIDARGFACAACAERTAWTDAARGSRYRGALGSILALPECRERTYEFDIATEIISASETSGENESMAPDDWRRKANANANWTRATRAERRGVIFVVDLNEDSERYREMIRATIDSSVEALAKEGGRFGVFTFRGDELEALDFATGGASDEDEVASNGPKSAFVLKYFDSHANAKKHAFIRRVRDVVTTSLEDIFPTASTSSAERRIRRRVCLGLRADGSPQYSTKRIFGPVLDEVLGAIEDAFDEGLMSSARVLTFLRGAPNAGVGACDVARGSASATLDLDAAAPTALDFEIASSATEELMIPAHDHYELVGERCALSGIEVDVVVVAPRSEMFRTSYCDVSTLAPLADRSGGRVLMYDDDDGESSTNYCHRAIVGDVRRLLVNSRGVNCTLRVRASGGLRATRAYGALVADAAYPGLYHIASCGAGDAFAFDFDYTSSEGLVLEPPYVKAPTIQMAFEYTTTTTTTSSDSNVVVERRRCRRVHTSSASIAKSVRDVYKTLDVGAVMTLITRHALANADEFGLVEARRLVLDWLVEFVAKAHVFANGSFDDVQISSPNSNHASFVDVEFSLLPRLSNVPRLTYGLLRSDALFPKMNADWMRVSRNICLRLCANDIESYLYPRLMEYKIGEDDLSIATRKRLRRDSLTRDDCVYVLDAPPKDVMVYTTMNATAALDNHGEWHAQFIHQRFGRTSREDCVLEPRVWRIRAGEDDPSMLDAYLVEELDVETSGIGRGYEGFVDNLRIRCAREIVAQKLAKTSL